MDTKESLKVALAVLRDSAKEVMAIAGQTENKQTMQFLMQIQNQITQILELLDQGKTV